MSPSSTRELVIVEFNGGLSGKDEIRVKCEKQTDSETNGDGNDETKSDLRARMTNRVSRSSSVGMETCCKRDCSYGDSVHTPRPHVEEEQVEVPVVVKPDTVANPWTEVVHSKNLAFRNVAIVGSVWF